MNLAHKYEMREKHIARKKRICQSVYGFDWYRKGDGYYNKGKIHCSCPMCSAKTNDRGYSKGFGPVSSVRFKASDGTEGSLQCMHYGTTHDRYGRKNLTITDRKKYDSMKAKELDWYGGFDEIK